jgi:SAM-dependent methyltransferase
VEQFLAANRDNWNDRTPVHLASKFYDIEGWLQGPKRPRRREVEALGDVDGLRLVHLQCHIGTDTLTFANAGAIVTGLDFSAPAIEGARDLAERAGLADRSTFVCANVYDAVSVLPNEAFDIVYVSLGALCWLPSVERWAEQVRALLAPGGRLYIHDSHPVMWALADDGRELAFTYFEEAEPHRDDADFTYTDGDVALAHTEQYEWNHGIGEIVSALLHNGLRLDQLIEHDWTVWPRFDFLVEVGHHQFTTPPGMPRMPMSYTIVASRPG